MKHDDRRERWTFEGREVIDGVPHLTWKCAPGKGRHRADVPDWKVGCAVDDFKEVTVGTTRSALGTAPHTWIP